MLALLHGAAETRVNRARAAGPHQRMARQVRREMRRHANRPHARDRRRRAGSRTSCAGSGGRRRRRSRPGSSARPARSCSRRPCTPARRARGRSRRCPGCSSSNTPCVDGYVTISADSRSRCSSAFASRSATSMLPSVVLATTTTRMPAMTALAGIGAVRRRRDQHDVARVVAAVAVVGANHHQAGELALRAGVRLQRHGGKAGDLAERRFELAEDLLVALRLLDRHERMQRRELRPGDRQHLGGRVQLHRARAERDHRRVEADVLALEAADVAHHLGLGVMRVEHRMRQERATSAPAPPDSRRSTPSRDRSIARRRRCASAVANTPTIASTSARFVVSSSAMLIVPSSR